MGICKYLCLFLLSGLLIGLLPGKAFCQAGRVDSTWAVRGRTLLPLTSSFYFGSMEKGVCLARQDSVHLLYLYPHSTVLSDDFAVIRTDVNGIIDTSWGDNGTVIVDVAGPLNDEPAVLQVLGGKIYLGGQAGDGNAAIVRLNADGSLDSTFSGDGKLTLDFGTTNERAVVFGLTTMTNPVKLMVGVSADSSFGMAVMAASNGAMDNTFSGDGKTTFAVGKGRLLGAYFEPNGGMAHLAGYAKGANDTARFSFAVLDVRVANATSTLKKYRLVRGNNYCTAVTVNQNGEMLMTGECREASTNKTYTGVFSYKALAQTANGNFGTQGRVVWRPNEADASGQTIKVRNVNGAWQILVGGVLIQSNGTESAYVLKLDQNGYIDPLFGVKGLTNIRFGQVRERISDMEFVGSQMEERIVAVGPYFDGLLWTKIRQNNGLPVRQGWFKVPSPTMANFTSVKPTNTSQYLQVCSDSGRMYRFIKNEDTIQTPPIYYWQQVGVGAKLKSIRDYKTNAPTTDYWVVGDSGFVATSGTDGLHNSYVKRATSTRQRLNSINSTENMIGVACGDSGLILHSTNLGATFAKRYSGTRKRLNKVYGRNFIVGDSGIILKTIDGGIIWRRKASGTTAALRSIVALPGRPFLIVGDSGIILRSTDVGETWLRVANADTNNLNAIDNTNMTLACGANGTILRTQDNGLTWRRQETGTTRKLNSIFSDALGQAICVGDSGMVLRTLDSGMFVAVRPVMPKHAVLDWALYPNPATNQVTIEVTMARWGQCRIELLDLVGRQQRVLADGVQAKGTSVLSIPIMGLPPGCYLVKLVLDGKAEVKKLVVE